MKRGSKLSRLFTALFIGGAATFGTAGCDADVQTALMSGLSDATTTAASALIEAAFLSVTPDEADAAQ